MPEAIARRVQIDLNTRTITPNQRVWRLFPGVSYQFLDDFTKQDVGFLDFPRLPMPANDVKLSQDDGLFAKIAFSSAVREKLLGDDPTEANTLKLDDFNNSRHTERRGRFRQAIINFYEEAKAGDLVVLPEPIYMSRIWVEEFSDDKLSEGFCISKYGKTPIPARSIRWIGNYRENTVSSKLSEALRNQHPFTLLERSVFIEVFSMAFGSFIFGDRHVSTICNGQLSL